MVGGFLFYRGRYDLGLVKFVELVDGRFLKPVNRMAVGTLFNIYASEFSRRDVALSSEIDEGARGMILQRQVVSMSAVLSQLHLV